MASRAILLLSILRIPVGAISLIENITVATIPLQYCMYDSVSFNFYSAFPTFQPHNQSQVSTFPSPFDVYSLLADTLQTANSSVGFNALVLPHYVYYGKFPVDLSLHAKRLGYDLLLLLESGDETYSGYVSRVFWITRTKCPIPVYYIPNNALSVLSQLQNQTGNLNLDVTSFNTELVFISSPVYIICSSVVLYLACVVLFFQSLRKIYLLGAPYTVTKAICACFMSAVLSLISCKLTLFL
jgi:hypothetical protein